MFYSFLIALIATSVLGHTDVTSTNAELTAPENEARRRFAKDLVEVGGKPTRVLGECEGDCDENFDCDTGLKCFHRSSQYVAPPGCKKGGTWSYDFCVKNEHLTHRGGSPDTSVVKLGECEGDCDFDRDCGEGLECYHRDSSDDVPPGCNKGGPGDVATFDYCVKKKYKLSGNNYCVNGDGAHVMNVPMPVYYWDGARNMIGPRTMKECKDLCDKHFEDSQRLGRPQDNCIAIEWYEHGSSGAYCHLVYRFDNEIIKAASGPRYLSSSCWVNVEEVGEPCAKVELDIVSWKTISDTTKPMAHMAIKRDARNCGSNVPFTYPFTVDTKTTKHTSSLFTLNNAWADSFAHGFNEEIAVSSTIGTKLLGDLTVAATVGAHQTWESQQSGSARSTNGTRTELNFAVKEGPFEFVVKPYKALRVKYDFIQREVEVEWTANAECLNKDGKLLEPVKKVKGKWSGIMGLAQEGTISHEDLACDVPPPPPCENNYVNRCNHITGPGRVESRDCCDYWAGNDFRGGAYNCDSVYAFWKDWMAENCKLSCGHCPSG